MNLNHPCVSSSRVVVDGKFFRVAGSKFLVKGVTYGPFAPNSDGDTFPSREQTACDFVRIRYLGANVMRVYYVPPPWLLDLAAEHGLKLLVDIPWEKHRCFLESFAMHRAARAAVQSAARACQGHEAIFAFSIANEIPAEIVRWHGAFEVATFLDQLVDEVKSIDPDLLCTFASFPPSEFLQPTKLDFLTFNVYLHERTAFEGYLARLQTLAGEKPLLLGEFGLDSLRETEEKKCEVLAWQIETAFFCGLAGTVLFSFTDDWFRGGQQIMDWGFGLTNADRTPKASFEIVREKYEAAPHFPLSRVPQVSVVVASYNGATTLRSCLDSLTRLNYPDYEVILVDDGSTDATQEIAADFPRVRNLRQTNLGLSAARNAGISAAHGEIVAFTDSDCRADEDWLYYLVGALLRSEFVGMGGPNFLPPEDSPVAAAVLVSPGGPSHVMLSDRDAEHIPGCNMAFFKWALDDIGGFDPVFRKAGDDVDVCWRLQKRGYKIGFSPGGFVWHHRRSTVRAYLRQQSGYGEAEALLARKHPEYFNVLGGGVWHGRIYAAALPGVVLQRAVIYHGIFGSGFFQKLYSRDPSLALMFCTSLQFHLFITFPLLMLAAWVTAFLPLAGSTLAVSLSICLAAAAQSRIPAGKGRVWTRLLVALLFFLQPIVRGWARYKERINPPTCHHHPERSVMAGELSPTCLNYWSKNGTDRYTFLQQAQKRVEQNGWFNRWDSGWNSFDLDVSVNRWSTTVVTTVAEELAVNKRFIRCRITARWSWFSWIIIALATTVALTVPLLSADQFPWAWMALCLVPLMLLVIEDRQRPPEFLLADCLQAAAKDLQLEAYAECDARHRPPGRD